MLETAASWFIVVDKPHFDQQKQAMELILTNVSKDFARELFLVTRAAERLLVREVSSAGQC